MADFLELGTDRGRREGPVQAPVELEPDREGELAEGVVQLVGDADALANPNGLGGLRVQASVLERHGRVVRRRPEHLDLFPLEHPARSVADGEDADRGVLVEERDREHRADRNLGGRLTIRDRQAGTGEEIGGRHQVSIA